MLVCLKNSLWQKDIIDALPDIPDWFLADIQAGHTETKCAVAPREYPTVSFGHSSVAEIPLLNPLSSY